jgi:LytS/YehU family sensor histidine kinase
MGDLLRVALHGNFESETTLSQELELTRAYLDLEKMRFGKKLETRLDVPESLASVPVPSLLLQPIVENAIHHGLASVTGTGVVQVSAFSQNGELVLTVADNGIVRNEEPDAEFPSGYGLGLTRKRLERMYADRARIQISRRPEVGTSVCIYIPLNQPLSRVPNESHALADCG